MIQQAIEYAQRPRVLMFGLGLAVVAAVLYIVWVKDLFGVKDSINANNSDQEPDMYANLFYAAGHTGPWGMFEDDTELLKLSKRVGNSDNWKAVCKAYLRIKGKDLSSEVSSWLNPSNLKKFYQNMGASI